METPDYNQLIADERERIRLVEGEIVAQNECIAALERAGRDARAARAIRASLWIKQESYLAEIDRLIEEQRKL